MGFEGLPSGCTQDMLFAAVVSLETRRKELGDKKSAHTWLRESQATSTGSHPE